MSWRASKYLMQHSEYHRAGLANIMVVLTLKKQTVIECDLIHNLPVAQSLDSAILVITS